MPQGNAGPRSGSLIIPTYVSEWESESEREREVAWESTSSERSIRSISREGAAGRVKERERKRETEFGPHDASFRGFAFLQLKVSIVMCAGDCLGVRE